MTPRTLFNLWALIALALAMCYGLFNGYLEDDEHGDLPVRQVFKHVYLD